MTKSRLQKEIEAADDELKFVEEIVKYNEGFRASRRRTKESQIASLAEFLNHPKVSKKVGNKYLLQAVSDCEEWISDKPRSHDRAKEQSENNDGHVNSKVLIKKSDFFDKYEKPIKLWVMAGLHSKAKHLHSTRQHFKFPLPTGQGLKLLNSEKGFKIPWNIYCPSNGERQIVKWKSLKKNIWQDPKQRSKTIKALRSKENETCDCKGNNCGESCFNRLFQLECDSSNCSIGPNCGNRNFTKLTKLLQQNNRYVNGVEVVSTGNKGSGLRAIRPYSAHCLIIEYTGEIIDQEEVERRLNEGYGGVNKHFYFLSIGQGLSIDGGTKGSVARFANHSCEPNAEIQKWVVNGEPRVGLFAGPSGIKPGDEITYHYNFEWFPDAEPQPCFCGALKCSGYIGKRTDSVSSKLSTPSSPQKNSRAVSPKLLTKSKNEITRRHKILPQLPPLIQTPRSEDKTKKIKKSTPKEEQNPYETRKTRSTRLNRHSEAFDFLDMTTLPLRLQRQLSINMAPPGEVDEVAVGMAQLAASAAMFHNGDFNSSKRRTRHAENESAIDAGIPLKFLKNGERTVLNEETTKVKKEPITRTPKRSVKKIKKTKRAKSPEFHGPNRYLPTRPLDKADMSIGSSKYLKLLRNLLIDDEIPAIMQSRSRRLVSLDVEIKKEKNNIKQKSQNTHISSKSDDKTPKIVKKSPKMSRFLSELMIDDKVPTVYKRSPRSINPSNKRRKLNPQQENRKTSLKKINFSVMPRMQESGLLMNNGYSIESRNVSSWLNNTPSLTTSIKRHNGHVGPTQ